MISEKYLVLNKPFVTEANSVSAKKWGSEIPFRCLSKREVKRAGFISAQNCTCHAIVYQCIEEPVTMHLLGQGSSNNILRVPGESCRQQVVLRHVQSRRQHFSNASAANQICFNVSRPSMEASASKTFTYRSVFISDLHLGTPQSQAHVLLPFLQQVRK